MVFLHFQLWAGGCSTSAGRHRLRVPSSCFPVIFLHFQLWAGGCSTDAGVRGNNVENSVCCGGLPPLVQTEYAVRRQNTCCADRIEYVLWYLDIHFSHCSPEPLKQRLGEQRCPKHPSESCTLMLISFIVPPSPSDSVRVNNVESPHWVP